MVTPNPFQRYLDSIDASSIPYGSLATVVAQCDAAELEYAALRKAVGLMDGSHRGLLRLTGKDRLDFLHRLVTQECKGMKPGDVRRAFVLNAKGRIMADLLIVHFEGETLIDTDIHQAAVVGEELNKLLFGEEVKIEDCSGSHHRVSLHGPAAGEALNWWRDQRPEGGWDYRYEEVGVEGVHLWAPTGLLGLFADRAESLREVFGLRFIGWMAWNIARVEAGRAMFNIDFGPDNLPHEAGLDVVKEAVNFSKGCYRGQEIVARMQSRGHPSRRLVGFRVEGEALPVAGVGARAGEAAESEVIGAVTSSTLSPMLGAVPIGLAMVKWGFHETGSRFYVPAEGKNVAATVVETPFYRKEPL